jgi:hypothetical protein
MEEKRSPGQLSLMDPGCETQVSGAQPELTDVGGYVVARIKTTNHTFGQAGYFAMVPPWLNCCPVHSSTSITTMYPRTGFQHYS